MIARIWHGWTEHENADRYEELLRTEILPGIADKSVQGYRGPHLLRRKHDEEVEFITVLWFDSLESVKAFQGQDYETAYVPASARKVLKRFDSYSQHYDVRLGPDDL